MEVGLRDGNWWHSERLAKAGATFVMALLFMACAYWISLIGEISDGLVRVILSKDYMAPGTRYLMWRNAGLLHCGYPAVGILVIWVTQKWERWLLLVLLLLCLHVMVSSFMYAAGAAALVPGTLHL